MRFASIADRLAGQGAAKWAVHIEGHRRAAAGEPVIMLSIGEPDLPPPGLVVEQAIESLRAGRTRYAPGQGEPRARAAIARHLGRRSGRVVSADDIVTVAGTQNGLFVTMSLLAEAGDDVLVPDPHYATYDGVVAATGARFVPVPTTPEDGFHLRPDALERAITAASRVLLLNSPANPTGAVLGPDEIAAIGDVCRRHDLWIVADEVYADLTLDGAFASPYDHPELVERTFAVASISKSHALPGFRSGWVACPPGTAPHLTSVVETVSFGSQPFLADALAVALDGEHAEVARLRETFRARATAMVEAFAGSPAAHARRPEGGMFVLVDIRPTGLTGEQFAWRLLDEEHVAVMPGESFGPGGAGHVRLALTVDVEPLRTACERIRQLAERLAS